jgi:hypothetical protein
MSSGIAFISKLSGYFESFARALGSYELASLPASGSLVSGLVEAYNALVSIGMPSLPTVIGYLSNSFGTGSFDFVSTGQSSGLESRRIAMDQLVAQAKDFRTSVVAPKIATLLAPLTTNIPEVEDVGDYTSVLASASVASDIGAMAAYNAAAVTTDQLSTLMPGLLLKENHNDDSLHYMRRRGDFFRDQWQSIAPHARELYSVSAVEHESCNATPAQLAGSSGPGVMVHNKGAALVNGDHFRTHNGTTTRLWVQGNAVAIDLALFIAPTSATYTFCAPISLLTVFAGGEIAGPTGANPNAADAHATAKLQFFFRNITAGTNIKAVPETRLSNGHYKAAFTAQVRLTEGDVVGFRTTQVVGAQVMFSVLDFKTYHHSAYEAYGSGSPAFLQHVGVGDYSADYINPSVLAALGEMSEYLTRKYPSASMANLKVTFGIPVAVTVASFATMCDMGFWMEDHSPDWPREAKRKSYKNWYAYVSAQMQRRYFIE